MSSDSSTPGLRLVDDLAEIEAPTIGAYCLHLKFPYAVVGGVLTLPTEERARSGDDRIWKPTTHLIERVAARLARAGGRKTEGDAAHLLEGVAVVVFDRASGVLDLSVPPPGCGLRWEEFIAVMAESYEARFGE